MAKISALTDGSPGLTSDEIAVARTGTNRKLPLSKLGFEYTLAQSAIPVIAGPSGTMANNGAVTWGTALPSAYTGGAWVIMPAGSIAAGVPAATAILWYVGTNTTTGTFYNSTYTSGVPALGTQTAYVTTGPGAFTGVTAETLTVGIQIPANSLGPNGAIIVEHSYGQTNNANAKSAKALFHTANAIAGTTVSNPNLQSIGQAAIVRAIQNRGLTNVQGSAVVASSGIADATPAAFSAIDTTAATWVNFTITRGTATDVVAMERMSVRIRYGA